jgi:hypothetical protein
MRNPHRNMALNTPREAKKRNKRAGGKARLKLAKKSTDNRVEVELSRIF